LPTIAITSPASAAAVTVTKGAGTPAEDDVPIAFTTTGITLMMPGSCLDKSDSIDNCGHVHLLIDGAMCTPSASGLPYNNATPATAAADGANASPVNAIVSSCPTVNGAHTVTLELHHDDHSPVNGADGTVISSQVMITVSGG
jgi:hypothetical protein